MPSSLEQIAELANVAVSTVSRALAGKPGVSAAKRAQIMECARRLNYVPDLHASLLRAGKNSGLTLVVPYRATGITMERNAALLYHGKQAFGTVRVLVKADSDDLDSVVRTALAQRSRAIVVSGISAGPTRETRDMLKDRGVALTFVDHADAEADCIRIDRITGACQAARLLLLSGCSHPVFFSRTTFEHADNRLVGIREAYRIEGKDESSIRLFPLHNYGSGMSAGYAATKDMLNTMPVDGLFCYSDEASIGTLRALAQAGVRVPQEVKVVGFDDIPVSAFLPLALTTIAQPVDEPARAAMEVTLQRLETPAGPQVARVFPARLVVRETAPILSHAMREEIFKIPEFGPDIIDHPTQM